MDGTFVHGCGSLAATIFPCGPEPLSLPKYFTTMGKHSATVFSSGPHRSIALELFELGRWHISVLFGSD